ncbi:hypothetical protein D3C72_2314170 [compost metagenome]
MAGGEGGRAEITLPDRGETIKIGPSELSQRMVYFLVSCCIGAERSGNAVNEA